MIGGIRVPVSLAEAFSLAFNLVGRVLDAHRHTKLPPSQWPLGSSLENVRNQIHGPEWLSFGKFYHRFLSGSLRKRENTALVQKGGSPEVGYPSGSSYWR